MKHPIREKRAQKISNHDISIDMDKTCNNSCRAEALLYCDLNEGILRIQRSY